jgi:hypothetical protein
MVAESPYFKKYLFSALASGPIILRHLLDGITDEEADFRADPDRFTLREAVAHLADWEPIFLGRFVRTVDEDRPLIHGLDEGELAVRNDYGSKDIHTELDRYEKGRADTIAYLSSLPDSAWPRLADRDEIGLVDLEFLVGLLPLHDAYHERQAIEWRAQFLTNR